MYEFYITPEEYKIAEQNGIGKKLLEHRIRGAAWKKHEAITTPPKKHKPLDKNWLKIAKENGISYDTFRYRVNIYGWSNERAATEPKWDSKQYSEHGKKIGGKNRKIPKKYIDLAAKNGISLKLLEHRINKQKLDFETAATRPVMTRQEISRVGNEAYYKIYNHTFASFASKSPKLKGD